MNNPLQKNISLDVNQQLEFIYDQYAPVMYGIAMQISSGADEAEQILFCAFKKIAKQKLYEQNHTLSCVRYIKLTIETTYELFPEYKIKPIQLKQFQRSPILNSLLCENMSIKSCSAQNNISNSQLMKNLKMELCLFLNIRRKYVIRMITIPA